MILDDIVEKVKERVEIRKETVSFLEMKKEAERLPKSTYSFEKKLKEEGIHFICEVKKASPSKGIIDEEFPYIQIAREYEQAGASCISVLTEEDFFLGSNEYLKEIKKTVTVPILRKDFIIDPYQIYESKVLHADCILLICSVLTKAQLKEYIEISDTLGLSVLVEAHDEEEIDKALSTGSRMIGVNNRNLKTFQVDINNSLKLRKLVPSDILFIAESGIQTREDVALLEEHGVNGVLVGETLMRAINKSQMLKELKGIV